MSNFISSDQTITNNGSLTIAHGLGAAPKYVKIFLVCQTADRGYAVGDVIEPIITSAGISGAQGCSVRVDATNLYVKYANDSGMFWAIEKGGSNLDMRLTNGSWKLRLYADTGEAGSYTSPDQTITNAGSVTLNHGMSSLPKHIQFYLVCQSAELGYSAGDVVTAINSSVGTQNTGIGVKPTSTQIIVKYANSGTLGGFMIVDKSLGTNNYITDTKWKLRVHAAPAAGTNFTSTDQTISSSGIVTLTHGLGGAPKFVDMYLVCTTADRGYSVGDTVRPHLTSAGLQNTGASFQVTSTQIIVRMANQGGNAGVFFCISAADNLDYPFYNLNWKLRVYAQR